MEVTLIDYMGSDLTVVNSARVSFKKKSRWVVGDNDAYDLSEKDQKLITYLGKEGHYAPFGHCFASFHVKAPIFVARQLVKHEYLRMSEVSRRYVTEQPEFYFPSNWYKSAENVKQGNSGEVIRNIHTDALPDWTQDSVKYYNQLLDSGVAAEQARMVLPLNTYTEWHWSGSLDAFANMYNLRTGPGAQGETKTIACMIGHELKEIYPHAWKALTNADH